MYIRFQGQRRNETSSSKLGVFQLAFELRDEGDVPKYLEAELLKNIQWLREHLKSPDVLDDAAHHRAISWFKPSAKEPIRRVRAIAAILNEHGYSIEQVQTRDPGVVIYEDGHQIIAKPNKGGP